MGETLEEFTARMGHEGLAAHLTRIEAKLDETLTTLRRHEIALKAGAIGSWGNATPAREGAL